ncbi:uncharacterized protein BXZ73DRAFT_93365 [Epithele typhae]|uniref:uncharacterized protein n=1 Tax=Epithele typhae TaxID=378194 RepID=UPI00200847C1|nr:uncharacterized protein BXZ73DRAFT_93365 [Epithele typhae]KAH9911472.1 hypothetical protein BXZ73DRAFT_93365 [Epithele typhae]
MGLNGWAYPRRTPYGTLLPVFLFDNRDPKSRPFAVSGRVLMDRAARALLQKKAAITYSLDFPIDVDVDMPPALGMPIASCLSHPTVDGYAEPKLVYSPPILPLTATLGREPPYPRRRVQLALPLAPRRPLPHHRARQARDLAEGKRARPPDSCVTKILVTLLVNTEGREEKFHGRGGKGANLEWTALIAGCEYKVQPVRAVARPTLAYAIHLKSFGTAGIHPDTLITPSGQFFYLLSPVLNMSRRRKIAFYPTADYDVNPGEVVAESLVPGGGESILYQVLKMYKLMPELHWTAGRHIWPVDQAVERTHENAELKGRCHPPPRTFPSSPPSPGAVRPRLWASSSASRTTADCNEEDCATGERVFRRAGGLVVEMRRAEVVLALDTPESRPRSEAIPRRCAATAFW